VIPLSRGGHHSIGNVLPACERCNLLKNARLLIQFKTILAALPPAVQTTGIGKAGAFLEGCR
jgi:5-methylcytosine-specific restriction endonuclease McrA